MSVTGSTTPETDRSGCGCEPMASHSLGVEPFVERTAVNRGGCRPLEGLVAQLKCLVRARVTREGVLVMRRSGVRFPKAALIICPSQRQIDGDNRMRRRSNRSR